MTSRPTSDVQESPVRGALIRQLRETFDSGNGSKPGLSRQVFATRAGISTSTLQRAEEGEPGTTLPVLRSIAETLGVPLSSIYAESLVEDVPMPREEADRRWEELDARLSAIEAMQREILRAVRGGR